MERTMKTNDWDFYKDSTPAGKWIRESGDLLYGILQSKLYDDADNAIRLSEHPECMVGIPYDYRAFRGLMGYVTRLAASHGLCFVASPIIKFPNDTYTITIEDWEIALIPNKVVDT